MAKIYKWLKSFCTTLGIIVLVTAIGAFVVRLYTAHSSKIPEHTMLAIDFSHNFGEQSTDNLIDELLDRQGMRLTDLIKSIEIAGADKRIDGIVARLDVSDLELAQIQDVARAIEIFRKSGKKTYVYSQVRTG